LRNGAAHRGAAPLIALPLNEKIRVVMIARVRTDSPCKLTPHADGNAEGLVVSMLGFI
jgi:hypothetical protein